MDQTDLSLVTRGLQTSRGEYLYLRDLAIWASSQGNPELSMRLFSAAAKFASLYHSGFFVDPVAENELLKIGRSIDETALVAPDGAAPTAANERSILHVLSEVSRVGGIWRTLIHWIRHDRHTRHTIVVLRQRDPHAVSWMQEQLVGTDTRIIALDAESRMVDRAIQVRHLARQGYTACVNHVGQAESIPTVAFSVSDCPPVLLIDHADHSFWLGTNTTDVIIHQRPIGAQVCSKRRDGQSCFVLPIPLETNDTFSQTPNLPSWDRHTNRNKARQLLGLQNSQIMALTIGRRDKYRPMNDQNFFREAALYARTHPEWVLHVVGVEQHQAELWAGVQLLRGQFSFHGEVPVEPILYCAADLYLESYPFGSQTAFLEAAQAGLAGVRAPVETTLLATSDDAVDDVIDPVTSEKQYWETVEFLCSHSVEREYLATQLRNNVLALHTGEAWVSVLKELYTRLETTTHTPRILRTKAPELPDHHDIALHRWHRWRGDEWTNDHMLRISVKTCINEVMYQQLRHSSYEQLPSLALHSLFKGRADRTILKMGLKSILGAAT